MKRCRECSAVENDEIDQCLGCGARDWAPEPPLVVDGRYEVLRKVGRGAMGVVYQARDIGLGRDVALKMISPMYAREPSMVERFQREARALATLRNDNVVQIYAFGPHGRSYYFAMEFVDGKTLATILDDHQSHHALVPVARALTVLRQIGGGLSSVHDKGLVHRDVKPSNVVVENGSGRPVVIDFGLVLQPNRGPNVKTMRSGTPSYMAPEQSSDQLLDSAALTPRTDVYSLGCTAFELFTGSPPFSSGEVQDMWQQHQSAAPPALSTFRPDLVVLEPVVLRALEKDPQLRYATCEGFVHALEKAAATVPGLARAPIVPRPAPQPTASLMGALLRVLVVAPDDARRPAIAEAASKAGGARLTAVDLAKSIDDAISELRKSPDVVIVDADAFGAGALSFYTRIRDLPDGANVRVLVLGGDPAERWRLDVFGVSDFVDARDEASVASGLHTIGARIGWAK